MWGPAAVGAAVALFSLAAVGHLERRPPCLFCSLPSLGLYHVWVSTLSLSGSFYVLVPFVFCSGASTAVPRSLTTCSIPPWAAPAPGSCAGARQPRGARVPARGAAQGAACIGRCGDEHERRWRRGAGRHQGGRRRGCKGQGAERGHARGTHSGGPCCVTGFGG
jgi:hypothetical protein